MTIVNLRSVIREAVQEAALLVQEVGTTKLSYKDLDAIWKGEPAEHDPMNHWAAGFDAKHHDDLEDADAKAMAALRLLKAKGGEIFGIGSSRATVLLTSKHILKLAKNAKGFAQNAAEVELSKKFPAITTKIFTVHPEYFYIVSELVKPLEADEFGSLSGIPFRLFHGIVRTYDRWNEDEAPEDHITPNNWFAQLKNSGTFGGKLGELKKATQSPFLKDILTAVDSGLMAGDLLNPEHYGKTTDGRIVLLDYGYTQDVMDQHYSESVESAIDEVGTSGVSPQSLDAAANADDGNHPGDEHAQMYSKIDKAEAFIKSRGGKLFGVGSARKTFILTSKTILKLAKNEKGFAQNEAEKQIQKKYPTITPKVIKASGDGLYLISELVNPLGESGAGENKFKAVFGFSWHIFEGFLNSAEYFNHDLKKIAVSVARHYDSDGAEKKEIMRCAKHPFVIELMKALADGLLAGDVAEIKHFGQTTDGRLVVLDVGFTQDVNAAYYGG
jgi:hypothetical protein